MPGDFSYYVDGNDATLPLIMDHYHAVKLTKEAFEAHSPEFLRKHIRQLMMQYHPDKNIDDRVHAETAFKRINEAWEILSDPQKKMKYDADEAAKKKKEAAETGISRLDQLLVHILYQRVGLPGALNFRAIVGLLKEEWNREGRNPKQYNIFMHLTAIARTGEDYYQLYEFTLSDSILSDRGGLTATYLQKAAGLGHLVAMRSVAGGALSGLYFPKNEAIRWALDAISYLENCAIPQLERNRERNQNLISELQAGLLRARERIGGDYKRAGKPIPSIYSKEFELLVAQLNEKPELKNAPAERLFVLSEETLDHLKAGDQLSDSAREQIIGLIDVQRLARSEAHNDYLSKRHSQTPYSQMNLNKKEAEERIRREAERVKKEAEEKNRREIEQAKKRAEEWLRKENERIKKEAEERRRKEAERAKKETEERIKKEAEEQARKKAEEQAKKEQDLKDPLLSMLSSLIKDISNPVGEGRSKYLMRGREEKIKGYTELRRWIENKKLFNLEEQEVLLSIIRDECAIKRNPFALGLFETHSSQKFQKLVMQNKLSVNKDISFSKEELKDLNQERITYLVEESLKENQQFANPNGVKKG